MRSLRETVTEVKCGFFANDDEEFVEYIARILADSDLWLELSTNAKEHVRKTISWRLIAKRTMDVYRNIIKVPQEHGMYIDL